MAVETKCPESLQIVLKLYGLKCFNPKNTEVHNHTQGLSTSISWENRVVIVRVIWFVILLMFAGSPTPRFFYFLFGLAS